jgi:hypothetical protein
MNDIKNEAANVPTRTPVSKSLQNSVVMMMTADTKLKQLLQRLPPSTLWLTSSQQFV